MSVKFILGASGTGKTTYIFREIIEKSEQDNHNPLFLIMPEQANLSAEQDMVRLHPKGGTMDISIVSFTRLAFKVFDELGVHTYDILDDYGKSMVIMKLLKRHQREFSYYGGMVGKPGFVDEVKSLFSEFYQYQVTPDVLGGIVNKIPLEKSLHHKLSDLYIMLNAFEDEMRNSYMVAEQLLALLAEVLEESAMLKNADIYFDGFTGFTPVQYKVINELLKCGCNLNFSFTIDGNLFGKNDYNEHGLFFMGKQSVDKLCRIAEDNNVSVLPHVSLTRFYRLEDKPELAHAERQLFRFPLNVYEGNNGCISIVESENVKSEVAFIAKMINHFVRDKGYHYRDIAVITGDLAKQTGVWNKVLEDAGIPYFLDAPESLIKNPVAVLTGMIMDMYRTDFSYESVISFLKTGYFEIDKRKIYDLENYVLKYGVHGYYRWGKTFRGNYKGLNSINQTRKEFIGIIEPLHSVFEKNSAKGSEYVKALYDFMVKNSIPEKIHEYSCLFEKTGELRQAKAYGEVYEAFIEVLDKTMKIMGDEELPREHFADILMSGINDVHLGIIPVTLDQVLVGDLERTRLSDVKLLFFAGVNEGLLPKNTDKKGILVDKDRMCLKEYELQLAGDSREEIFKQQFYMYLQMTKASEKVYICYREKDETGNPIRPSYFVNRIKSLLPGIETENAGTVLSREHIDELPMNDKELLSMFAGDVMDDDIDDSTIFHLLKENDSERLSRILDGYFYSNNVGLLDEKIARMIYGSDMVHSVSRLETYVGCAYRFFLQYGIKIKKRDLYTVENTDVGIILHAVMEQFFKGVKNGSIAYHDMKDNEIEEVVEQMTMGVVDDIDKENERDPIFESSNRSRHQLEVIVRIAKRSIHYLLHHLDMGGMEPEYFEKKFEPEDNLDYTSMNLVNGLRMNLRGIVDRTDIKVTEDAVYVKVIDYKSGAKKLEYEKIFEGKQLQLVVYMSVMTELLKKRYPDKKIIPTGMYYYHVQDPIIEAEDVEKLEKMRNNANRLSGLVNQDENSLELMDGKTGEVVPVMYKKDNDLDSRNQYLVTTEELKMMSDFVKEKMTHIGNEIVHGQIEINPEKGEINSPCNFCDFRNVCRFEPGLGGDHYKIGSDLTKQEAKELIFNKNAGKDTLKDVTERKGGDE